MNPKQQARTFFFEDSPAGYFQAERLPSSPGEYRYVPYRSVGHYRLIGAVKSQGPQRCYYVVDGKKYCFTVEARISYGVLELSGFDGADSTA